MNLQQHFVPASLAAMAHVALLLSGGKPLDLVVAPPVPADEVVREVRISIPNEPDVDSCPAEETGVKPLKGDPQPPGIDELLTNENSQDISIAIEKQKMIPDVNVKVNKIGVPGDPNGDPNGKLNVKSGYIMPTMLDNPPRAKSQLPPHYPAAMKQAKVDGEVWVEFDVDKKGRVVGARVQRSSDRAFEEATLQAVLKWRFEPGRKEGIPVPFRMVVPVNFRLSEA